MRLLLAYLDQDAQETWRAALAECGHVVEILERGQEIAADVLDRKYDILLVGDARPEIGPEDVARALRRGQAGIPILVLGSNEIAAKVSALEAGADDFVSKGVSCDELTARIRALARRGSSDEGAWLRHSTLEMHLAGRTVRCGENPIRLTPREFALLEQLLRQPGRTVPRSQLYARVWGESLSQGGDNVVDVYISRLRRKLGGGGKELIQTVPGTGYMLASNERSSPPQVSDGLLTSA